MNTAEMLEPFIQNIANELQKFVLRVADEHGVLEAHTQVQARLDQAYGMYDAMIQQDRAQRLATARAAVSSDATGNRDAFLVAARTFLEIGEFDAARLTAERLLAAEPDLVPARILLGRILVVGGKADEALKIIGDLTASSFEDGNACKELGTILRAAGRIEDAARMFRRAMDLFADQNSKKNAQLELAFTLLALGKTNEAIREFTRDPLRAPWERTLVCGLVHDIDQIEYLSSKQRIGPENRDYVVLLRRVLDELTAPEKSFSEIVLSDVEKNVLERNLRSSIYAPACDALEGSALNPDLKIERIEDEYKNTSMVAIDDFLNPEALDRLTRYCQEATLWRRSFPGGYVGAFPEEGFCPPLLLQIARELALRFPSIFRNYMLLRFWAFKYDRRLLGIPIHADPAKVNVNLWLTDDAANCDPETGGLIVWDKLAPPDWTPGEYNTNYIRIRRFLQESGATARKFSYKRNRVVIFDSDLFHETDALNFKAGYENRRTNTTLLYGEGTGLRHYYY